MSLAHSACSKRNYTNLLCHLTCWLLGPKHCQSCANTGCSHTENEVYLFFQQKLVNLSPEQPRKWCNWKLPVAVSAAVKLDPRGEQWECPRCPEHSSERKPKFRFNPEISSLSKKRSLIPEVSHRLPAHCPSRCLCHGAQLVCDFPQDCSSPWLGQVHHSSQQEERECSEQTLHHFSLDQKGHTRTPEPSSQIQETQMEFKPRAAKQTKVHMHKNPWKPNNNYHKATET